MFIPSILYYDYINVSQSTQPTSRLSVTDIEVFKLTKYPGTNGITDQ
jgi:hypothetical protein